MKSENTTKTNLSEETLMKPSAAAQPKKEEKKGKKSLSPLWASVLVGGVPGILIGSAGTLAVEEAMAQPVNPEETEEINDTPEETVEVQVAHNVTNDMSFSEAFAAARAEVGPGGAFVWHGNVYGTYRGDDPEWQEMSAEDRAAHSQLIMSQVHREPYEPTENEPEITLNPNEPQDTTVSEPEPEDTDGEVDVHIVGVGLVETEDGDYIEVAHGDVNGQAAVFADSDGDGEVDTVLIDENGDGNIDYDEVYDAEGSGIMMSDLEMAAMENAQGMGDELYADMPDYTNDADTSSLV